MSKHRDEFLNKHLPLILNREDLCVKYLEALERKGITFSCKIEELTHEDMKKAIIAIYKACQKQEMH